MDRLPFEDVVSVCAEAFVSLGVESGDAEVLSRSLVLADAKGLHSHGIVRLPQYVHRIQQGHVDPACRVEVIREKASSMLVDGNNGLGVPIGIKTMDLLTEKAADTGIAIATVKRSNHFGTAGFIAERANISGCIGYAATNGPARMAAYGGVSPVFGTSPFACAVPFGSGQSIVVDMSTSVVARGKIQLAAKAGEAIPEGWAVDINGISTTDARKALDGAVLPFGGPKGSAIAMLIEIFAGVLGGYRWGRMVGDHHVDGSGETGIGHSLMAVNIEAFGNSDEFEENVSDLVDQIKADTGHSQKSVYLPGELEQGRQEWSLEHGVRVPEKVVTEVDSVLRSLHLPTIG